MTDLQVRDAVLQELEYEPMVNPAGIGVAVEEGVVTLNGTVESCVGKLAAERAVKRVFPVRGVVNHLVVRLEARDERSDSELAVEVVRTLDNLAALPPGIIRPTVRGGHVILEGDVTWRHQATVAAQVVRQLRGVREVQNRIAIRPAVPAASIRTHIEEALQRRTAVDPGEIEVEVDGSRVVLKGRVRGWHAVEEALDAAWKAPGVVQVEDRLTVQP